VETTQQVEQELIALVHLWMSHKPTGGRTSDGTFGSATVPEALVATMTGSDEHLFADAKLWLGAQAPLGLGLRYALTEYNIHRDEQGREIIAPFCFEARWASRMSTMAPGWDSCSYKFAKLVKEGGRWKVAAILNEAVRAEWLRQIKILEALRRS
jgi:hypothetical protein